MRLVPLLAAALLLSACHAMPATAARAMAAKPQAHAAKAVPVQAKTVAEAAAFLQATPDAQFIDVRTPAEFAEGHAVGAVNLPLDQLQSWAPTLDPRRALVVICRSGSRSGKACSMLSAGEFKALINVSGGTLAWEAAGLPMAK